MIYGDFNHTERIEDSVGPSPLLRGLERRVWNRVLDKFDLLDNRSIVVKKIGSHFTCQATHGSRFDQSHMDRSYCSNRGMWLTYVGEVLHNATQSLFDHHPMITCIILNQRVAPMLRKTSYLKMNAEELKVDSTRGVVECA